MNHHRRFDRELDRVRGAQRGGARHFDFGRGRFLKGLVLASLSVSLPEAALAIDPGEDGAGLIDPYPAVAWIDRDGHGGSVVSPRTDECTGTLIAPDLVVTAAHCFWDQGPSPQATVGFGVDNTHRFNSASVTLHPRWTVGGPPTPSTVPSGTHSDLAVIRLSTPVPPTVATPAPLLLRGPRVGDEHIIVGYGDNHTPPKRWSGPPHDVPIAPVTSPALDAIDNEFVDWNIMGFLEAGIEEGDSGGPGFLNALGFSFVKSAHQGTFVSSNVERATRIDQQARNSGGDTGSPAGYVQQSNIDFIQAHMPNPISVQVTHNIPAQPSLLPANTPVGITITATYPASRNTYVFDPFIYEDDSLFGSSTFDGDLALRPTLGLDDLMGFSYGAGIFPDAGRTVTTHQSITAGELVPYGENFLDRPPFELDWVLDINPQFDLTANNDPQVTFTNDFQAVQAAFDAAVASGAIPVAFQMVPEPSSLMVLIVGGSALMARPRQAT